MRREDPQCERVFGCTKRAKTHLAAGSPRHNGATPDTLARSLTGDVIQLFDPATVAIDDLKNHLKESLIESGERLGEIRERLVSAGQPSPLSDSEELAKGRRRAMAVLEPPRAIRTRPTPRKRATFPNVLAAPQSKEILMSKTMTAPQAERYTMTQLIASVQIVHDHAADLALRLDASRGSAHDAERHVDFSVDAGRRGWHHPAWRGWLAVLGLRRVGPRRHDGLDPGWRNSPT